MIALYLLLVLAWTLVCVQAGRIVQTYLDQREDMAARDAWAERYQHEHKGAA